MSEFKTFPALTPKYNNVTISDKYFIPVGEKSGGRTFSCTIPSSNAKKLKGYRPQSNSAPPSSDTTRQSF